MLSVGVSKSQPVPSLPLPHAPVPQPGKINNYKRFSALQPYTRLSSLQRLARDGVVCERRERPRCCTVVLYQCIMQYQLVSYSAVSAESGGSWRLFQVRSYRPPVQTLSPPALRSLSLHHPPHTTPHHTNNSQPMYQI